MALFQIQNLRSKEVHRKISVNVILPIDSHREHQPGEKFRTLYLFHGVTDNNTAWLLNTRLYELAERYNLCVVLPNGENSFYMDREDRFENWGRFFAQELPMLLRRAFPLSERREDTFIGGFSMGGYGALRNGLKYHDAFGKICCFAPALELEYTMDSTYDAEDYLRNRGFVEAHYGKGLEDAVETDKNPLWLIDQLSAQGVELPKIFLATGEDDGLLPVQQSIVQHLEAAKADYTAHVAPGSHEWDFLNRNLETALQWLTKD